MRTRILNSSILIPIAWRCLPGAAACRLKARAPNLFQKAPGAASKTLTLTRANADKFSRSFTVVVATAEGLPPDRTVIRGRRSTAAGWLKTATAFEANGSPRARKSWRDPRSVQTGDSRLVSPFRRITAAHASPSPMRVCSLAQGGIEVTQTFEVHPSEGPIGTPIELRVTGFGWRTMDSTWVVNWDNQEVGYVSATDTRGSAVARFAPPVRWATTRSRCTPATWARVI